MYVKITSSVRNVMLWLGNLMEQITITLYQLGDTVQNPYTDHPGGTLKSN